MKYRLIILSVISLILTAFDAFAFGRRNHAAVAYIAERHVSPATRKAVASIYDGLSLAEYASWPDDNRLDVLLELDKDEIVYEDGKPYLKGPDGKPFCFGSSFFVKDDGSVWTTVPHGWYAAGDGDGDYVKVPKGDCIWGAEYYAGILRDRQNHTPEELRTALNMVVHFIGDMHCPSHVHYADRRDRNDLKYTVIYSGSEILYHKLWDTSFLVDRYPGGMIDFAWYCDPLISGTLPEREALLRMHGIQAGIPEDWAEDILSRIQPAFSPEPGSAISKDQMEVFAPLGRDMVMRAGYRLAAFLDDIFRQ